MLPSIKPYTLTYMKRLCLFFIILSEAQAAIKIEVNDAISIANLNHNPTPECFIEDSSKLNNEKNLILEDNCNFFGLPVLLSKKNVITNQRHISEYQTNPSLPISLYLRHYVKV
ncbi:hypothetical protein [Vibrio algivorus]|uniref:Uncharacterized protein n=1 Tax=Vibrio algivorus TaxID=1667024 RepID=A0A557PGY8_9VIBR|nr:hypothetical protein [Vibrio algivorus]TVO39919.1 hypothetical protein FOF44_00160 [Vibrio algivorus]